MVLDRGCERTNCYHRGCPTSLLATFRRRITDEVYADANARQIRDFKSSTRITSLTQAEI